MADINIQMKNKIGETWNKLFPKTKISLVEGLPAKLDDVDTRLNAAATKTEVNAKIGVVNEQLAETTDQFSSQWVNAVFPPAPLMPVVEGNLIDAAPAIQAAINYASTFNPKKRVFIPEGLYKIAGLVTITCDFESRGVFCIYDGGKFKTIGSGINLYKFIATVMDIAIDYDIVLWQASNSDIHSIVVSYDGPSSDIPLFTALNFKSELFPDGVWDVTVHDAYFSNTKVGIQLTAHGYVTDITIKNVTFRGFYTCGINFDNSAHVAGTGVDLVYCTVQSINFQNNRVSPNTKTCIHVEGMGHVIDDIKIFNDQPTVGILKAITASDHIMDSLITNLDTINLAVHCTMNTATRISNIRAEGLVDLGKMRNLYKIDNVHVYQALNNTHYGGFNFHYDYEPDYSEYQVDLSSVTVSTTIPTDITVVQEEHNLQIKMNSTANFRVLMNLPQYIIDAANTSGYLVLAMTTDIRNKNATSSFINFAVSSEDLSIIHPVNQSTNLHHEGKIMALYNPLSGTQVPGTAIVYLNVDGVAGDTYKINFVKVYSELVNPIKDLTPYLKNV